MRRITIFLYGTVSYIVFLASFLYAIGFIGNFAVPKSLDSPAELPWQTALAIDLGLLSLFAVQHSVMARPAFKRMITRVIPASAERSTYVLASSLALFFLFWKWSPLGGVIWDVPSTAGRVALYAGYAFGLGLVLVATFVINHFDLFGLRQVWLHLLGRSDKPMRFVTPGPYRVVRHPLYVGWLFAFWMTPVMTLAHLLFSIATTAYILLAIQFEERDLLREHGEAYQSYRRSVPMLVPFSRKRGSDPASGAVKDAANVYLSGKG